MEEPIRVLVVEDEEPIRRFITINLERNGFEVIGTASGLEALELVAAKRPALVVLDLMLPDLDGYEICRRLRETEPDAAVIMLTARGQDMDKIMGLELGADDYMVKPFNPLELVARIRSVLRRTLKTREDQPEDHVCISGPFRLDLKSNELHKNGTRIDLTPKEFQLIRIFIEHPNTAMSRDELLDKVWGDDYVGEPKTVDVHVRRIREKIEDEPSRPRYIETVWGFGYRWREDEPR